MSNFWRAMLYLHTVPNNTAPEGSFSTAMNKLKELRQEVKENAGHDKNAWDWLTLGLGNWWAALAIIGITVVAVMIVMAILFCCIIPILRTMFANVIAKQMSSATMNHMSIASGFELTQLITGQPDLFPVPDYEEDSDTDSGTSDISGLTVV